MPHRDGFAEWLGSALGEIGRAAGAEAGRALEGARHELVDRAWFGRTAPDATPSAFEAWAEIEPAETVPVHNDALGRTTDEPVHDLEPQSLEIER